MDHFRNIFSNLISVNVQPAAVKLLPSSADEDTANLEPAAVSLYKTVSLAH